MRRRRRKRESCFTQLFSKKITWVILVTMVMSFIAIPNIITKANDSNVIKVLEIEPGNKFRLTSVAASGSNPAVEVIHMDMPTFISNIDDINGSYNVLYIGRDNDGLDSYWSTNKVYRDYTNPMSQERTALQGDYGKLDKNPSEYRLAAQSIWYATQGRWDYYDNNSWNKLLNAQSGKITTKIGSDTKTIREYYSENDITNKRAEEIKKMIESNQLVYIDSSVFQNGGGKDLSRTKLQSNFSKYSNSQYSNYHRVENNNLDVNKIISDYSNMSSKYKIPNVDHIVGPNGDVYKDDNNNNVVVNDLEKRADNRNMSFQFDLTNTAVGMEYKAVLYLDTNGDGLYSEEEERVDNIYNLGTDAGTKTINYQLSPTFVGYLKWKIVVYSEPIGTNASIEQLTSTNRIKTNLYGSAIFKSMTGTKIKLNVLQIKSSVDNKLDLSTTTNSNSKFAEYLKAADDYDIKIDSVDSNWLNGASYSDVSKYNMIIIGFTDGYGNKINNYKFANDFNENAVKIIEQFDKEDKSIMLTHDTIGLSILDNATINGSQFSNIQGGTLFTRRFRDVVGQSRYTDPFSSNTNNIKHDDESTKYMNSNDITLGTTAYSSIKLYSDYAMTSKVKKINSAQITSYPYELDELDQSKSNTLSVCNTHPQWYQLNLEEQDLVPWYNLSKDDNYNSGDSRNFNYTYSIGNITYSGTGHDGDYINHPDELKLFVNTIVKAATAGNRQPDITNRESDNSTIISDGSTVTTNEVNDFKFYVNLHDLDGINGNNMKLYITTDDGQDLFPTRNVIYNRSASKFGGIDQEITIPSSYLSKRVGTNIKVFVDGEDAYGAKAIQKQTFYLQVVPDKIDIKHGVDLTSENNIQSPNWNQNNVDSYISVDTKGEKYYNVVPFVARINMYNSAAKINLKLDSRFSPNYDPKDPIKAINTAYSIPIIYAVKADGTLIELGKMVTDDKGVNYYYNIAQNDVINAGGNVVDGRYYLVVKYSGKTYYVDRSKDNTTTNYKNSISVIRNDNQVSEDADISIAFKKIFGTLY